jgi:hypothetical protein
MNELRNLYEEESKKNEILTERWNLRFADHCKRVNAIVEIANEERISVYNDVESLIRDNNRFLIDDIMVYEPYEWLSKRNQVIVKFVETLTRNNNNIPLSTEKLFKIVVAVDSIYGARHGKYVSEIHLAASAVKYSITRSKKAINIDNHITSAGSYHRFQTWLEGLSDREEPLPEGLLFLAFDNEQRGQRPILIVDLIQWFTMLLPVSWVSIWHRITKFNILIHPGLILLIGYDTKNFIISALKCKMPSTKNYTYMFLRFLLCYLMKNYPQLIPLILL